ncbi:unnamed protein product [Phytophthora fragariaefolia]|uniref:Unnamed protein product n=1 Tax=Phytophthora fragariaefolia TaxID=1490495 RepID=A0A9W6YA96_9STRA|nr:unnamed protein product [Phytophthora fragariaefolia]
MSPSYADTVKLVEDNYFHWGFNMRMMLSRKGLLTRIVKPEFDAVRDWSTVQWKTNDPKALGGIAGDVSLTYRVYICGATTAAEAWRLLEEQFNRNTPKNRLIVAKKLHNFKMESETRFAVYFDGIVPDDQYRTPLAYAIQALSGVDVSDESSSTQEKAFASKTKEFGKRLVIGKCFYCKKPGHKESECRKKNADEGRGQVARATSDFAFTATGEMEKSEWPVDSGASSHMTSIRDKFVSMKELKVLVRITIADCTKIDAVATGTVGFKLMNGTTVILSDVSYILEIDGSLISVSSWPRRTSWRCSARTSVYFAFAMQRSWRRNVVGMSISCRQ